MGIYTRVMALPPEALRLNAMLHELLAVIRAEAESK
jgi:hypothetical protein